MSAVLRDSLDALTHLPERTELDAILAEDQWQAQRALATSIGDAAAFGALSDLEVASAYLFGDASLHDALYCELHRRGLSPWAIAPNPACEVAP